MIMPIFTGRLRLKSTNREQALSNLDCQTYQVD